MTIPEIAAIIVAAVALIACWQSLNRNKTLQAKLDRMQSTLYETRQEQRAMQEQIELRIAELDLALQKATGQMRFDPGMALTELYEIEPRAQTVLAGFHIGGCASCAVDENASLARAVQERGADLDRVLTALNSLPSNGERVELRAPNVRFEL